MSLVETSLRKEFAEILLPENTIKHIDFLGDVDTHIKLVNEHLDWTTPNVGTIDPSNYVDKDTTDHLLFSNIGTNSHASIDTHIANTTLHFLMLDEDDLTSDSDTKAATQQSIKAYIATQVTDSSLFSFKTITGIANDVVADATDDTLTFASGNSILGIVGTTATDTITFTIDETVIDHDVLKNFVANEHIDWTNASDNFDTSGTALISGVLTIGSNLVHEGDSNTFIEFLTDRISFIAGNVAFIRINKTTQNILNINSGGVDIDTIIESENDTEAFKVDANADEVSIGASSTHNIKGEAKGQVVAFVYNRSTAASSDQNMKWGNTSASGVSGDGIIMPKAGSVISHTTSIDITAATSGAVTLEVEIDNVIITTLENEFLASGGTGRKTAIKNISRNTSGATFTAGQNLSVRANETGIMEWDDIFGVVLVQFDT